MLPDELAEEIIKSEKLQKHSHVVYAVIDYLYLKNKISIRVEKLVMQKIVEVIDKEIDTLANSARENSNEMDVESLIDNFSTINILCGIKQKIIGSNWT